MLKFEIAGVEIGVTSNKTVIHKGLNSFYIGSHENLECDLLINGSKSDMVLQPGTRIVLEDRIQWRRNVNNFNSISACIFGQDTKDILYSFHIDDKWKKAFINSHDEEFELQTAILGPIGEILFRNRILFHQGIVMHAAAIDWKGKGIMFSAPAGTGKSTQANLWKSYLGATVLNGDRPAVRIVDNLPYVYGTPWSGSTPEYINSKAPLNAIVLLEQAKENSISRIKGAEAVSRIMPRCFLPYYDVDMMKLAMKNLEDIISATPVYLMRCKPDREAVELVYQCIT